jgi:hypothetical protein
VAASNQRTPAGRRLPVTLAAGSAADSSRPDTRPRPKTDTRAPPRWTAAAAAGLPGPAVAVPARCGRPCAPRLLGCGGQSGQAGAAGGHRRSGHADSGRGLWTPIARDRTAIWTPATAAGVIGHCCSGPAGQPAAEPSTTMTPVSKRRGSAVRIAVSPGHRQPSMAKLCVLLTRSSADRQRERKAPGAGAGAPIGEDRVVGPVDLGSAPEVKADTLALSSSPKADSGREGKMHNHHAGLTGVLAEQHITERHRQATHEQLLRSARLPRRRQQATRRWWQLVLRPVGV